MFWTYISLPQYPAGVFLPDVPAGHPHFVWILVSIAVLQEKPDHTDTNTGPTYTAVYNGRNLNMAGTVEMVQTPDTKICWGFFKTKVFANIFCTVFSKNPHQKYFFLFLEKFMSEVFGVRAMELKPQGKIFNFKIWKSLLNNNPRSPPVSEHWLSYNGLKLAANYTAGWPPDADAMVTLFSCRKSLNLDGKEMHWKPPLYEYKSSSWISVHCEMQDPIWILFTPKE